MHEGHKQKDVLVDEELKQLRSLTEVNHLLKSMHPDGYIPGNVLSDVKTNLYTASSELSMPYAVTETFQPVDHIETEDGRRRRMFVWMGRSLVANTLRANQFHFSEAAAKRASYETAEANRDEEQLRPGLAHSFISLKATRKDAPSDIAKAEHFHDDDSVRVSYAVTNSSGEVIGRRLVSLLVRDIPTEAWASMLNDPSNLWGKSFRINDEESALSFMELFDRLDIPEDTVPDGPINIVEAVLPYIADEDARQSVIRQIHGFKSDQAMYRYHAEQTAQQWLNFDIELAKSLRGGHATSAIEEYIAALQSEWSTDNLKIINEHADPNGGWIMSPRLAAALEDSRKQALNGIAAVNTGNQEIIRQISPNSLRAIKGWQEYINILESNNASIGEIRYAQMQVSKAIAKENVALDRGCTGASENNFRGRSDGGDESSSYKEGGKESWTWKKGKCQVKNCPSPIPTDVGPCSVCRLCQAKFDKGLDPTKSKVIELKLGEEFKKDKAINLANFASETVIKHIEYDNNVKEPSRKELAGVR